jgi:serine phosphatase RsbU (regulator of sigma subunit)
VSLIVGTLRTLAEYSSEPAEILAGLNRRLHGRLHGGFATCVVLRLNGDGRCMMANAGHPSPFLNHGEIELPGALPLGLDAEATYEETTRQLQVGDHLLLYTDGLLEARTAEGELYSFERLRELVATKPNAEQATMAAQAFGQDDDITVLTLTRLAAGEESTMRLTAPMLSPVFAAA